MVDLFRRNLVTENVPALNHIPEGRNSRYKNCDEARSTLKSIHELLPQKTNIDFKFHASDVISPFYKSTMPRRKKKIFHRECHYCNPIYHCVLFSKAPGCLRYTLPLLFIPINRVPPLFHASYFSTTIFFVLPRTVASCSGVSHN